MCYKVSMTNKRQKLCLMFLYGVDSLLKKYHNFLIFLRNKLDQKIYDDSIEDNDYESAKRNGL